MVEASFVGTPPTIPSTILAKLMRCVMRVKGKGNVIVHSWKWICPICEKTGYKYISKWKAIRGFRKHMSCRHDKVIELVGQEFDITKVEPRLEHNPVRGYTSYYSSVPMDFSIRKNNFFKSYDTKEVLKEEEKEGDIIV